MPIITPQYAHFIQIATSSHVSSAGLEAALLWSGGQMIFMLLIESLHTCLIVIMPNYIGASQAFLDHGLFLNTGFSPVTVPITSNWSCGSANPLHFVTFQTAWKTDLEALEVEVFHPALVLFNGWSGCWGGCLAYFVGDSPWVHGAVWTKNSQRATEIRSLKSYVMCDSLVPWGATV